MPDERHTAEDLASFLVDLDEYILQNSAEGHPKATVCRFVFFNRLSRKTQTCWTILDAASADSTVPMVQCRRCSITDVTHGL